MRRGGEGECERRDLLEDRSRERDRRRLLRPGERDRDRFLLLLEEDDEDVEEEDDEPSLRREERSLSREERSLSLLDDDDEEELSLRSRSRRELEEDEDEDLSAESAEEAATPSLLPTGASVCCALSSSISREKQLVVCGLDCVFWLRPPFSFLFPGENRQACQLCEARSIPLVKKFRKNTFSINGGALLEPERGNGAKRRASLPLSGLLEVRPPL